MRQIVQNEVSYNNLNPGIKYDYAHAPINDVASIDSKGGITVYEKYNAFLCVINAHTKESTEYFAKIIFVNAACLNSNLILLNSTSARFPKGLGNDNDILGRYIAFQNYRGSLSATIDGFEDSYYYGRRPVSPLMPSFRNVYKQETDFL
ncbi:MAG TPA: hypothetical protein VMY77_01670, partial [Chitinophagaceae bacterium]|nr:hypothetical protein [Chitinophagaceae bacterium]